MDFHESIQRAKHEFQQIEHLQRKDPMSEEDKQRLLDMTQKLQQFVYQEDQLILHTNNIMRELVPQIQKHIE